MERIDVVSEISGEGVIDTEGDSLVLREAMRDSKEDSEAMIAEGLLRGVDEVESNMEDVAVTMIELVARTSVALGEGLTLFDWILLRDGVNDARALPETTLPDASADAETVGN